MISQFDKLDDLIIEHTKPPVTSMLRNQLAATREQIEAYQAASDKQVQTVEAQAEMITHLQEHNAKLEAVIKKFQTQDDDYLADALRKHREFMRKHELNYDRKK